MDTSNDNSINDEQTDLELFDDADPAPASLPTKSKKAQGKGKRDKKKRGKKGKAQQPSKKEQDGVPLCADALSIQRSILDSDGTREVSVTQTYRRV